MIRFLTYNSAKLNQNQIIRVLISFRTEILERVTTPALHDVMISRLIVAHRLRTRTIVDIQISHVLGQFIAVTAVRVMIASARISR